MRASGIRECQIRPGTAGERARADAGAREPSRKRGAGPRPISPRVPLAGRLGSPDSGSAGWVGGPEGRDLEHLPPSTLQECIPCPSPPRGRTLSLTSGAWVGPPDPDAGPRPPAPLASRSSTRARAAQFPAPGSAGRLKGAARRPASADRKAGSARAGPSRGSAAARSGLQPTPHKNPQLLGSAARSVQPGGASEGLAHPDLRNLPRSIQQLPPERRRLLRSRAAPGAERGAGRPAPPRPYRALGAGERVGTRGATVPAGDARVRPGIGSLFTEHLLCAWCCRARAVKVSGSLFSEGSEGQTQVHKHA